MSEVDMQRAIAKLVRRVDIHSTSEVLQGGFFIILLEREEQEFCFVRLGRGAYGASAFRDEQML
jgi:hypothetical protein